MPARNKHGVFISYSHHDALLVAPVVKLIRAIRHDLVFQDTTNLKPGMKWEPQLLEAIESAQTVLVFWCEHSAASAYVKREYEIAIENAKDVLPLLIDDTKLVEELAAYQGIDFRGSFAHETIDPAARRISRPDFDLNPARSDIIASAIIEKLNERFPKADGT